MNKENSILEKLNIILPIYNYTLDKIKIDGKILLLSIVVHNKYENKNDIIKELNKNDIINGIHSVQYRAKGKLLHFYCFLSNKYCDDNNPFIKLQKKRKTIIVTSLELEKIKENVNIDDTIINKKTTIFNIAMKELKDYRKDFNSNGTDTVTDNTKIFNKKGKKLKKVKECYEEVRRLSLEEFLKEMNDIYLEKGRISTRKRHWVYFIKSNKLECPATKKLVAYCSYDLNKKSKTFHYNFYSSDGELFTVDHKVPISKGGSKNKLGNVQPMIAEPNFEKNNQLLYI